MSRLQKLREWIKNPHGWTLVLFYVVTAISVAGAIVFSVIGQDYYFIAYVFYALAAITFGYTVYTVVLFVPKVKRKIIGKLQKYEFTNRLYEQYGFRTVVFAVFSLIISLLNAVFYGVMGIWSLSIWYGAIAAYYFMLASIRGGILLYHRKRKKLSDVETDEQLKIREVKRYRTCGILLILLPLALSGVILETVLHERAFVKTGILIYVAAAYTTYKVTMAIVNFVKARKSDEMTVRAIRNVNLADALVSILALQTAMFHEFSQEVNLGFANALTGTVVCALTVTIGIIMLVKGSMQIKRLKTELYNGEQQ